MNSRRLIVFGVFSLGIVAGQAADRDFTRTFPVQPGCTLKVDTYRGRIEVVESDQLEVRVNLQVEIGAETEAEADRIFSGLNLTANEEGNVVTLRARNPRETRARFVWNDKNQTELAWRISVPRQCNVELTTLRGGITVGNLTGGVVARSETGVISLKRIEGSIDARIETGDVVVSRCSGSVRIRVLSGQIRVGSIGGLADLKNSTGDIEVLSAPAGIVASAEAGDVSVGFPRNTVGDAKLSTAGGNVIARIDPQARCAIDASVVWGRVESLLPLVVESGGHGKKKLVGRLGSGGPTLTFHANGGHVKISPGETYFETGSGSPESSVPTTLR